MKIKEFKAVLGKKRADFALFCNSDSSRYNANMLYFSGYKGLGALAVPKSKPAFLIAPDMEIERARRSMVSPTSR